MEEENLYDNEAKFFDARTLTKEQLRSQDLKTMLLGMSDDDMREQIIFACRDRAKEIKYATIWDEWLKQFSKELARVKVRTVSNMEDKEVQGYDFGDYAIDNKGLHYYDSNANCYRDFCKGTPLVVSRIFENIDSEPQKVELTFKLRGRWKTVCSELRTVSDSRQVLSLSDSGISVNTTNSSLIVGYITDFIALNQEKIPVVPSVGRLGWFGSEFIPYDNEYAYDGFNGNKERFEAVTCVGSLGKWVEECSAVRSSPIVRMLIDASLSSPLLEKIKAQIFLVHLWGTTEAGKTVAMQFAMSVWGEPEKLIQSFNATEVGMERISMFYKHLPVALDELQIIKDKYNDTDKIIYRLCNGQNKMRGNKFGGNDEQSVWRNVIITNGEQPLTEDSSGGGAKNRAIELHCDCKLFSDFQRTLEVMRANYGNAGKSFIDEFVKPLSKNNTLIKAYKYLCGELTKNNFTDKQRNSIAAMCLADYGYNTLFLKLEPIKALSNALEFYRSHANMFADKEDIKIGKRSYDDFLSWVIMNGNKFRSPYSGDVFGIFEGNYVYILPKALDKWSIDSGISKKAALAEWREQGYMNCGDKKDNRTMKNINNMPNIKCYQIKMEKSDFITGFKSVTDPDILDMFN